MADVTINYKGAKIAEIAERGSKTLKTAGTYCEGDIEVLYEPINVKRWDVLITTGVPSSGVTLNLITNDAWLAENRSNPKLCVVVLPKFTVPYSSTVRNQGVFLNTNMALATNSSGVLHYSMSAYIHTNGNPTARMRDRTLTNGSDIGDIGISTSGTLYVYVLNNYPMAAGEYVVYAFIV